MTESKIEIIQPPAQAIEVSNGPSFGITVAEHNGPEITVSFQSSGVFVEDSPLDRVVEVNLASGGSGLVQDVLDFETDQVLELGQPVIVTDGLARGVIDNQAATVPLGIFGLVSALVDATHVKVIILGRLTAFSGLTLGSPYFLSETGEIAPMPPTSGVIQQLGLAVSSDTLFVSPQKASGALLNVVPSMAIDFSGGDLSIDTGLRDNSGSTFDSGLRLDNGSF